MYEPHATRNRACEARWQRNEGAAVQAGAPHDAVHRECCSRHVAEILQKEEEQIEDRNFL